MSCTRVGVLKGGDTWSVWRRLRVPREELSFLFDRESVVRSRVVGRCRACLWHSLVCMWRGPVCIRRSVKIQALEVKVRSSVAVLITATGLQGEKPLVDRRM